MRPATTEKDEVAEKDGASWRSKHLSWTPLRYDPSSLSDIVGGGLDPVVEAVERRIEKLTGVLVSSDLDIIRVECTLMGHQILLQGCRPTPRSNP